MMKKRISVIVASVLSMSLLASCSSSTPSTTAAGTAAGTTAADTTTADTTAPATTSAGNVAEAPVPAAAGSIVKMGLGIKTSVAKSKAFIAEAPGSAQADVVVAAVGFDADGKVASIYIDNAQTKVEFNADGTVKSDKAAEIQSKQELKDAYGMVKASKIGKEWYQQIEALAAFFQGKTIEEIKATKTKAGADANHPAVPDEADLATAVSITIQDYIAVVEEAWNNAIDVTGGADKVGLGITTSIGKSADKTADKGAAAQIDNNIVAVALKGDKVAATILDVVQAKVEFDQEGALVTDVTQEAKSKVDLGDAYGMKKASKIGKEWFEQAKGFADWTVGKTLDEIKAAEGEDGKAKDTDLASSMTVGVSDYIKSLDEAAAKAR